MVDISRVVRELKIKRSKIQSELKSLDDAIDALDELDRARPIPRRRISLAARRRIAIAQKARWTKWRARHRKKK